MIFSTNVKDKIKTVNDIFDLVSKAKSTVWLNPGTYVIDKPLTPNPKASTFILYAIGSTLIVKSNFMFNFNGDKLGIVGGIIKPFPASQLVNGQNTTVYLDKVQMANSPSFLGNISTEAFPPYFAIEM